MRAIHQQAVCPGCAAAIADDGGDQVAVLVCMLLGAAASTACAVGVDGSVEQPRRGVAAEHSGIGVAVQGLRGVVGTCDLEAAPCVQAIPLDALVGQRASGGGAVLVGNACS